MNEQRIIDSEAAIARGPHMGYDDDEADQAPEPTPPEDIGNAFAELLFDEAGDIGCALGDGSCDAYIVGELRALWEKAVRHPEPRRKHLTY